MLNGLFEFISGALSFFYDLVPNYAVAIGLLTLCVMVVTTPLTLKGTRSMIEMQRFQPEIRRLQAQYKDDPQKRNEEMMRFYREHNINPVGGCFPLLVQAPVFSILYWVVQGLTNRANFVGLQRALEPLGLDVPITITDGFRPKYLDHSSALYRSLLGSHTMDSFGIDLARSASEALSDGILEALPYLGLVAIIAGLSWFQQKQIMGRQAGSDIPQQQKMMMKLGPALYVFFAFVSPAAIGVYFLVSTAWRVGQQAYITHSLYGHDEAPGRQAQRALAEAKGQKKDGGGGLLAGLTGSRDRDDAPRGGARAKDRADKAVSNGKAGAARSDRPSSNGSTTGRRKTGAGSASSRSGSGATTGPGGTSAKPHPRSRKKKKRK